MCKNVTLGLENSAKSFVPQQMELLYAAATTMLVT